LEFLHFIGITELFAGILLVKNFISIHKPSASIRFAPIKQTLAVTVEPFKFSSRQGGVAYELSEMKIKFHGVKMMESFCGHIRFFC